VGWSLHVSGLQVAQGDQCVVEGYQARYKSRVTLGDERGLGVKALIERWARVRERDRRLP